MAGPHRRKVDFVGQDLGPRVRVEGVSDRIVDLDLVGPSSGLLVVAGRVVVVVNPVPPDMCQAFHLQFLVWDRVGDVVQTVVVDRKEVFDCILVAAADLVDRTRHWGQGKYYLEKVVLAGHIVVVEISVLVQVLDRRVVVEEVDHQDGVARHPVAEVARHVHSSSALDGLSYHHIVHDLTAGEEAHCGPNFVDHRVVRILFVVGVNQS